MISGYFIFSITLFLLSLAYLTYIFKIYLPYKKATSREEANENDLLSNLLSFHKTEETGRE